MLKKLQLITLFVAISLASFAQDWIEVNSGLSDGLGIGQISVGMNDQDALWALAIASDGLIYDAFTRSTDGGQTWTAGSFNAGTGLSQLFAIDANTCWAVFNTGADQGLYKTEDGGATWEKKGTAYGSGSFTNVIHFFNDNDGFAQGDPVDGYYELYTTDDGGESWTRVPEENIPAPTSGEYGITGNYSAYGDNIWFGTNQGRVFYSTDKGATWDVTLTAFGSTEVVQPLFKNESVGIAFRSYLDMGIEPTLNVTTDGGETWSSLNVSGDMYARWFDFIPGSTSTWLGSSSEPGAEGISFSLDDGANWNDLTVGVPVQAPEFLDNETGWAGTWVEGGAGGILIYDGDPIGGGGGAEIVEDFEAYNAGEKLVEQALAAGIDYWTCWSGDGGAGSAEDGTVTTEQAYAGANSVLCEGTNDFVMKFGDKTAGKYSVDFYIYIPDGFVGYYNLLQAWAPGGTGATWGLEIYFNPGGIAEITAEGVTGIDIFNYNYDEWVHMENIIDLNNDEATLLVNGEEILVWEWSVGASGGGINQLAAMDIYAATTNGTPYFFIDDIQLIELEPPVGPASIAVDPTSFNVSLESGQMTNEMLTVSNEGIATLNWDAYVQFPGMANSAKTAERSAEPEAQTELKSTEVPATQMTTGAGAPYPNNNEDEVILHYDGDNASGVGLTNGGGFEFGARFTGDMTGQYIGMEITEVDVYVYDVVTASTIKIYGHGTQESPGAVLIEQDFAATPSAWNTVVLDEPITISGGDIWVTCYLEHDAGLYVAGNDAGPHVENGDWFKSGASWVPMHIANPEIDANWNIRALAMGDPMEAWLTLDPISGETPGGDSDEITLTFDASGVASGTYMANVIINSNDPENPQTIVPVTMEVGGTPPAAVAEIDFEDQEDFALTFDPWTAVDIDGGGTYGFSGIEFPNAYEPMAYIAFNPASTVPPMIDDPEIQPHSGERFGACFATVPPPGNDDWMISPQVQLGSNSMLNLWVKSYTDQYGLERYNIGVSTTGMDPEDFEIISASPYEEAPVTWTEKTYDLSAYDGQMVYVGIQCVSYDAFVFMIDDVMITSTVGVDEVDAGQLNVYPNPAQDVVNINSTVALKSVKVVNYTGQVVYETPVSGNQTQINTNDFAAGIYVLQLETENGISTRKLIIE